MGNQCIEKIVFLSYREKIKKIYSSDFLVGCFARIDFYLTLETRNKSIFSIQIIFVKLWFFEQSEFEKKWKSINRLFAHWKRQTSEHWCWENYFPTDEIVHSLEKRSTRLHFSSLLIILVKFPFIFTGINLFSRSILIHFHSSCRIKFVLSDNFTYQWKFSVWTNCCFSLIEKKTPKNLFLRVSGWFFCCNWLLFNLRNM